jgi:serine/threonine protein phosphatase PrpC
MVRNDKKIYLSRDFRPTREKEKGRIMKRNGYITSDGRLLGQITVSRSFGDWRFKDPKKSEHLKRNIRVETEFDEYLISNRAEFRLVELDLKQDEYIIIVSDGIFQHVASNNVIFDIINKYLNLEKNDNQNIKNIPNVTDNVRLDIINNIYGDVNMKNKQADNMTLILIHLQNNKN